MEILRNVLLVLHFIGLSAIIGGVLVQLRGTTRRIDAYVLHGAYTQLLTGIGLVGLLEAGDGTVNHTKVGVKLAVLVVILVLAFVNRKRESVPASVLGAIGGLTVLNVVLAVFW